jgi:hypothetical protein
MPSLLESLIEERALSDLSFAESILAEPSSVSAGLAACLKILRAAAMITIRDLRGGRPAGTEDAGHCCDDEQEPTSEEGETHDGP